MIIHLIRHGQTNWNVKSLYQGIKDIPLNDVGLNQANKLAKRLQSFSFNSLYSSPLSRAFKTAEAINQPHGLSVVIRENLKEISLGGWEGKDREAIKKSHPKSVGTFSKDVIDIRPPGGESFRDLQFRVQESFKEILHSHEDKDEIVIVTHGGVIKNIIADALKMKLEDRKLLLIDNASISTLIYHVKEETFFLKRYNDTAHIEH